MQIRKRDLMWGITGGLLVAAVVAYGLGEILMGAVFTVVLLAVGWVAGTTPLSTGSAPVWLMPPTQFPETAVTVTEEPEPVVVDEGFSPFYAAGDAPDA